MSTDTQTRLDRHLTKVARADVAEQFAARSVAAALAPQDGRAASRHDGGKLRAPYHGHDLSVEITYVYMVDNKMLHVHLTVGPDGLVSSHALPYESFRSPMELLQRFVDTFPELFTPHTVPTEAHEAGRGR